MNATSVLLAMALLMSGVKFYEFDVNVRAGETHDDEYEDESDEAQSTKPSASLKSYRKLFMNGLELALHDVERAEDDQDDEEDHARERIEENLIVRDKDELEFECELPEHMHAIGFDWSLNGVSLKLNESSFLFKMSDYKPTHVDEFRVVCHFQLNHQPTVFNVSFPALTLGKFLHINGPLALISILENSKTRHFYIQILLALK